jgi:hypothetical protein
MWLKTELRSPSRIPHRSYIILHPLHPFDLFLQVLTANTCPPLSPRGRMPNLHTRSRRVSLGETLSQGVAHSLLVVDSTWDFFTRNGP